MDNALVVKIQKDAHTFLWLCSLLHRVENMLSMDTPSGSLHSFGFVSAYWNTSITGMNNRVQCTDISYVDYVGAYLTLGVELKLVFQ